MAKYDDELARMLFLMEEKEAVKKPSGNIVYHANGADGKVYGILREGTKFYIKTTESGKENIAESYDYLGGINNRREHEYKSCNEAEKHLENELMFLNEKYGKHEDVSVVDFKRGEKTLSYLTEEARKEIDRMNQIYENSFISKDNIGNHGNPENKGTATGAQTEKNNEPFSDKATASLDKDPKAKGTVEGATSDYKNVEKGVDADLQSDKMKKANSGSENDYKDTHDDLDGEGVADKKPSGGKVVRVNEDKHFDSEFDKAGFVNPNDASNPLSPAADDSDSDKYLPNPPEEVNIDTDELNLDGEGKDITPEDFGGEAVGDDTVGQGEDIPEAPDPSEDPNNPDALGIGGGVGDEEDLDTLLEEFESTYGEPSVDHSNQDMIAGEDDVMKNFCSNKGTDSKDAEWERINEEDGNVNEPTKQGNEETMKSFQKKGNLPVQSWDKMDKKVMNEAINSIVEDVYAKLTGKKVVKESKKKETLQEAIDRIVKEEVTRLNAWGKHPRYGQEPFKTPENKEVLAGTAEKDWNDDSAKGSERYGKKIGDGKPFDKIVDMLTDQVMAQLTAKK